LETSGRCNSQLHSLQQEKSLFLPHLLSNNSSHNNIKVTMETIAINLLHPLVKSLSNKDGWATQCHNTNLKFLPNTNINPKFTTLSTPWHQSTLLKSHLQ
jgi:hypothetical protein